MFHLSYSEPEENSAVEQEPTSRLGIDLEALRQQVLRKSVSEEILQMDSSDLIFLVEECIFWKEEAMEAQAAFHRAQSLADEAFAKIDELAKLNGQLARETGEF